MASFLRRPSHIARGATAAVDCLCCSRSINPSAVRARVQSFPRHSNLRAYATVGSGPPEPPQDQEPQKENRKARKDRNGEKKQKPENQVDNIPGKVPPGFENMFNKNSKSSPISGPSGGSNPNDGSTPSASPLTQDEIKMLEDFVEKLKKSASPSQVQNMDRALESIKAKGIPQEFQDLMKEIGLEPNKDLKNFSLGSAIRAIRILTNVSGMKEDETSKTTQEGSKNKQKQGEKKSRQQENKQGAAIPPNGFPFKFDTNMFLISAFITYYIYRTINPSENSRDITWQEFRTTFFDKGLVDKLTVFNRKRVRVELHRERVAQMYPESPAVHSGFYYYFTIGSVESFERRLDQAHNELDIPSAERIPVAYEDEVAWGSALLNVLPTALLLGGLFWLSRRASGGAGGQSGIFGIGKSRAKRFNQETDVKVKFNDVAGMDEAKVEIMEFVSFLKDPGQYQKLGAKIPRGAILSGPPGTGKTLLAKATAGESGVPFFSVSGSEFVEMFVGVGPSRVRDLFSNARKNTPCIIFIDEIDAIGKSRGSRQMSGGNDERESTLNQILTEMDGFNTSEQVVVLAGTNRPDVLDRALLRPGRFDRHISIDRPTMDGRKQIFMVHLKKIVTSIDMGYLTGRLSALTPGFSGADIANCVNEAALIAARARATEVTMEHFEAAIERVIGGLEKKSVVLSPEEKKTVAYHEAGHAICGWFFKYADPLLKVSIIPRGQGALGYAQYLPAGGNDVYLMSVHQLMDRMAMTLGGRVSEELWFDTVTSGASDDFNKVTRMATAMVTEWGMSQKIGYLHYKDDEQRLHKPFSEETARNIDAEVRRIVDDAYKQCKDLLTERKKQVQMVAEELLSKEMLVRDDLVRLLGKRPFEDKGEFSKYFDNKEKGKSAPPPPPTEDEGKGPELPAPAQ
ncbi:MAG: hypothetical protein Q9227_006536 [Pyrenula ochraceoflavens]